MKRGRAPFQIDRKGYVLTLHSVPAWICRQCGEAYFEDKAVDAIQEVIRSMDVKTKELAASA
jgi:YgiT-type zinc finger domain-containing protein